MATPQDGGPAFPATREEPLELHPEARARMAAAYNVPEPTLTPVHEVRYPGMTLRDYFAAQALPAVLDVETTASGEIGRTNYGAYTVARLCYELADAMLKFREEQ